MVGAFLLAASEMFKNALITSSFIVMRKFFLFFFYNVSWCTYVLALVSEKDLAHLHV